MGTLLTITGRKYFLLLLLALVPAIEEYAQADSSIIKDPHSHLVENFRVIDDRIQASCEKKARISFCTAPGSLICEKCPAYQNLRKKIPNPEIQLWKKLVPPKSISFNPKEKQKSQKQQTTQKKYSNMEVAGDFNEVSTNSIPMDFDVHVLLRDVEFIGKSIREEVDGYDLAYRGFFKNNSLAVGGDNYECSESLDSLERSLQDRSKVSKRLERYYNNLNSRLERIQVKFRKVFFEQDRVIFFIGKCEGMPELIAQMNEDLHKQKIILKELADYHGGKALDQTSYALTLKKIQKRCGFPSESGGGAGR